MEETRDVRPIPDPTLLTTAALTREIASLKEILFTRLEGMDRAIVLFNDSITRVPTDTDRQIARLKELIEEMFKVTDERFSSIQKQFSERDVRTEQNARDSKVAVDAALAAQEKAVGKQTDSFAQSIAKSEANTTKQIDAQGQLLGSTSGALNDKIEAVKERLTRIEGEGKGERAAGVTQQTSNMNTVSVIGLVLGSLIGIAGLAFAVAQAFR